MWLRSLLLPTLHLLWLQCGCAAAYFENCDNLFNLKPGTTFLESPTYPNKYPAGSSCRYKFVAPVDHYIIVNCQLDIAMSGSTCSTDNFYVDRDGDKQLRGSENLCGRGGFQRSSFFRSLVLAYISTGKSGGTFRCSLNVRPQSCSCGWSAATRIANGKEAGKTEFPSMAALKQVDSQKAFCGVTILSHRHVVTAAHCVANRNANNLVIVVGAPNLANPTASKYHAQHRVQRIIVHEQYQDTSNDIAILVTASQIDWSRGVGPACLPPTGTADQFAYDIVDVIGWGSTFFTGPVSSTLRKVELMVVSKADCRSEYAGVSDAQICTYDYTGSSRDSCQYDSGGPALLRRARHFLIGVISYGKECAVGRYPMGVNTRITHYLPWIQKKIANTHCAQSTIS